MEEKMKKLIALFLVFSALFMLSAGGNSEAETATTGPVAIELWSSLSGTKANVFDEQVARFNQSQTDVQVNVIHQGGYSILRQKVAAAANAGNMPDMIICDYLDVAYYAQLGLLKSLDDLLPQELINDYYDSMLSDLTYEGKLYAIPYNRSTQGFYVNNDVLKAAGIDRVASTWDEFLEDVTKKSEYIVKELTGAKGIKSIAGMGLMLGLETDKENTEIVSAAREKGVLLLTAKNKVRLIPPLCITFEELEKAIKVIKEVCA